MARWVVVAALLALAVGAASAEHPTTDRCGTWFATTDVGGVAYVAWDSIGGFWIYVESNGKPGLQRGGHDVSGLGEDYCSPGGPPDQLVF